MRSVIDGAEAQARALARAAASAGRVWRWRMLLRPSDSTIARVKERKERRRREGWEYTEDPRVSIVVQSFNQARNVATLEARLRRTCAEELIVCEDGSLDGSHEEWLHRLTRPNDFLLHSNDIHEIRSYGRAIAFARGEIVCLMQDDDRPPADGAWLERALDVFDRHPRLAVLGGWCGFNEWFAEEYNAPWLPAGEGAIPTADAETGEPLMFVESVNIGPYLLRKEVFEELGGFDLRFSPPGEPGITFEAELCYRVWLHGYEVALTDIPVKLDTGRETYIFPGGTSLWGLEERERNERANKELLEVLYGDHMPGIQKAVRRSNRRLVPVASAEGSAHGSRADADDVPRRARRES